MEFWRSKVTIGTDRLFLKMSCGSEDEFIMLELCLAM